MIKQLRKECTSRKFRLKRKTPAAEKIKRLREFDTFQQTITTVTEFEASPAATASTRSQHCCARLLNVLFSDTFCVRFSETGDKPSRQQLDTRDLNGHSVFWKDVAQEFNSNKTSYGDLLSESARFAGIGPAVIVQHDAAKLHDMWKSINGKYVKAVAKFTCSGEHNSDLLCSLQQLAGWSIFA